MRYLALKALIAIVSGIVLIQHIKISNLYLLGLITIALVLGFFTKGYSLYFALTLSSAINFNQQKILHSTIERFSLFNTPIKIKLQIIEEPIESNNRYSAKILTINNSSFSGKVFLFIKHADNKVLSYGDIIECTSPIVPFDFTRNPNLVDYNQYYHKQGYLGNVFVTQSELKILKTKQGNRFMQYLIIPLRHYFFKTIDNFFDGNEKDLLLGLLLGEKRGMSKSMKETFADAGVAHILAVSGLHVAILIGVMLLLLPIIRIRGVWQLIIIIIVIILYLSIVGFKASAFRAGLMALFASLGWFIERRYFPINGVFVSAIIILLISPQALTEISFQLSFLAVTAIILITDKIYKLFKETKMNDFIKRYIILPSIVSFSASIGTAPIILYYFFRYPALVVFANLLIVPLVGLAIPLGFIVTFFNLFFKPLAGIYANTLWLLLKLIILISEHFARLSWQMIRLGRPSILSIIIFYLIVSLILFWQNKRFRKISLALILIGINFSIWQYVFQPKHLSITFLDIKQGDAVFLELPNKRKMLIDAGEENDVVLQFLNSKGIRSIDLAVITHPHLDHYGGFRNLLEDIKILNVIISTDVSKDTLYINLIENLKQKGTNILYAERGQLINGLGLKAEIFSPNAEIKRIYNLNALNINDISVVLRLEYNNTSLLFPGDLDDAEFIAGLPVQSKILKSPHHGSKKANSPLLFEVVKPEYIIIMGKKKVDSDLTELIGQYKIKPFNIRSDGALIVNIKKSEIIFKRFNGQKYFIKDIPY
ncbi:MAG: DNA internalization-related competence protein ComEC/Rec2 [candidate division WOR-3 bacterium]